MAFMADIRVTHEAQVTVISFPAVFQRLRETEVEQIASTFLAAMQGAQPRKVLIDLEGVEFFGSSFIELLVRGWKRIKEDQQGVFALCSVSPYCVEVLQVTHIDEVWPRYNTKQEALLAMAS
jgi:anti-sigma B factor antagonist